MKRKVLLQLPIVFSFLLLLNACGGGSTPTTSTDPTATTISGTAQAPAGSIAQIDQQKPFMLATLDFVMPPAWAAVTGLTPIANATVELIRIDDDGNQVGSVLASATTDSIGEYTLELPAGVEPAADLVLQIKNSSNVPVLRAIVSTTTVNIDPVSQFIVNTLINETGLVLASIDIETVQSLVQQIDAIDINFSLVSTLEDAANTVVGNSEISQAVETVATAENANSLIFGAWGTVTSASDAGMMVFYSDGAYINYQTDQQDCPDGGVEYGSYSYVGGSLTVNPTSDQNGQCGLKGLGDTTEASYTVNIVNDGNQLDLIVFDPVTQSNETASFPRVSDGNADSIVGGWDTHTVEEPDTGLVFYANGRYIMFQPANSDQNCASGGVEYGTYSYNGSTITGNILRDDNQSCGLGEGTGGFSLTTVTVADSMLTFDDGGGEVFEFPRVETGNTGSSSGNPTPTDEISIVNGRVKMSQAFTNTDGVATRQTTRIVPLTVNSRVDRIEADVSVDAGSLRSGSGRIETDIRLNYVIPTNSGNNYSQYAVIRLRESADVNGQVVQLFLGMDRIEPNGSSYELLIEPATDGSAGDLINFGPVANWSAEAAMSVEWNDTQQMFTFAYGGASVNLPIALFNGNGEAIARGVSFDPNNFVGIQIRSRVRTTSQGDSGAIAAYYDNFMVDGVLYDDFSAGSLSNVNWSTLIQ